MLDNSVLVSVDEKPDWFPGRCRFLGVDLLGRAVLISLENKRLGPTTATMATLQRALADGEIKAVVGPQYRLPEDLSEAARKSYDFWKPHVEPLIRGEVRQDLFDESERARVIVRLANDAKKPEITARRVLYRVLRAGCSLLGLCQDLHLRGGPGKLQAKGTKKRGRKALPGGIRSEVAAAEVRGVMEDAVEQYVVKEGKSVPQAHRELIAKSFSVTTVQENGKIATEPRPEAEIPTLPQLRRVAKQREVAVKFKGRSAPLERPGKAKDGIPGPGYRYEIDATGARLEMVSEFDLRQPIGSANAYGVLDVWSTACVGGVLGVFHAGYAAAQRALFNSFTNKKDVCARWDIEIEEGFWPCHHVPRFVLGDRGEMASEGADALPVELNVTCQNTAAYQPQMKGTVERWFCDLKASDLRQLIGFGRRPERGEQDPRLQAALTRYDGMRIFLLRAIQYNLEPAPVEAIPPEMLFMGYEKISRITLWQWGMLHLISGARIEDPRIIFTALLRKVDATIREDGLYVEGFRYISAELRLSGLLRRAAASGAIAVQATVDDYHSRMVWYRTSLDAAWQPAILADKRLALYDATFQELHEYYRRRSNVHARSAISSAPVCSAIGDGLISISNDAVLRQGKPVSRGKGKGKVRQARAVDAESERREHGAQVMSSVVQPPAPPRCPAEESPAPATDFDKRLALTRSLFLNK